jgi:glucose-6-phosphate isomerase/transaldolase/glucose-6-phosphate isomerase
VNELLLDTLGTYKRPVEEAIARLDHANALARVWRGDHTVWRSDPTALADRLGWLTAPVAMRRRAGQMELLAREVCDAGFRHVVLLGMGGSVFGARAITRATGPVPGHPSLLVLDSTLPATIRKVAEAVEPARTLFVVSSKSGTTLESVSPLKHFWAWTERTESQEAIGDHFVAITDEGTPLASLAHEKRFRCVFLNPSDVGGRYSILTYFGLVPAALAGADVRGILDSACRMAEACGPGVAAASNPAVILGVAIATLAQHGRDKLTILASPDAAPLTPIIEQLIAEGLGKDGKGIIPVINEPLLEPSRYGDDRAFVHLKGAAAASEVDTLIERLRSDGHPTLTLACDLPRGLGAELYRWEFATAIAGAILGVQPFNQPDVESAKVCTRSLLNAHGKSGRLPATPPGPFSSLLTSVHPGDYFAILAYLPDSAEYAKALSGLRSAIANKHRIATTAEYGPRYLHSTGQLHKGGPNKGLHLILTGGWGEDIPIPHQPYSFRTLAEAQARGDAQALHERGRRVASLDLGPDPLEAIEQLISEVTGNSRP